MDEEMITTQKAPGSAEAEQVKPRGLPMWVVLAAFGVLFAFLALIYWGLNRAQKGSVAVGEVAPTFTFESFGGETINTADLRGKVVVVNFWASWCGPCEQEADELEEAWRHYEPGGDVIFLGIAWTDEDNKAMEYLEKFNITYINGPDMRTAISQAYRIRGVPETYIIDRDGVLAYRKIGPFISVEEIFDAVDAVAAAAP